MLLDGKREYGVGPRRIVVHQRRCRCSEVAALVQARGEVLGVVNCLLAESVNRDGAVLLLSDIYLVVSLTCRHCLVQAAGVKQVIQLLVVNLQKAAFYYELCLRLSFVYFLKNQPYHPRYDSQLVLAQPDGVTRAHRPGLSGTSLPVGQNGCIEALEAPKNQVLDALVEHSFLTALLAETRVVGEGLVASYRDHLGI